MAFVTLFKTTRTRKKKSEVPKEPKRIKKIVEHTNTAKDIIAKSFTKRGRPKMPKHVMKINDWLYITCDRCTFKLVEVNDKVNPKTGEKYPDKPFLYAPHLDQMIEVLMHYMTRDVPRDFIEMHERLDNIKEIIMDRIPLNCKPKDLFEEFKGDDTIEDD